MAISDFKKEQRIALNIEQHNDAYENNILRVRRKKNYFENGYVILGINTIRQGVIYKILTFGYHKMAPSKYYKVLKI